MWTPTHAQITVHRARNLKEKGKSGTNDVYAIIQLGGESHRTSVQERTKEPVWNEDYVFSIPPELRSTDVVRLSLHHRNLLSLDEFLGQTEIPLYRLRIHDPPRVRRYALSGKQRSGRSSFSKTLFGHHSKSSSSVSGSDYGGSTSSTGGSSSSIGSSNSSSSGVSSVGGCGGREGGSLSDEGHGEIEVTVSFKVETLTDKQRSVLRVKRQASEGVDESERASRRLSMPVIAGDVSASAAKARNRRSLMSLLDIPQAFDSLRGKQRGSPTHDVTLSTVEEGKENDKPTKRRSSTLETPNQESRYLPGDRDSGVFYDNASSPAIIAITPRNSSIREHSSIAEAGEFERKDSSIMMDESPSSLVREYSVGGELEEVNNEQLTERKAEKEEKAATFLSIKNREDIQRLQPSDADIGLFCGYDREDLISTVMRQHARLALAEAYIGDLEHYIDILVLRALQAHPRLLQNSFDPPTPVPPLPQRPGAPPHRPPNKRTVTGRVVGRR